MAPRIVRVDEESSEAIFTNHMPEHIQLGVRIVQALQDVPRLREYRKHVH